MTYYNDQFNGVKPLNGFVTVKVYGEGATNHLNLDESQFEEFKTFMIDLLNRKADEVNQHNKKLIAKGETL